MWGFENYSLGAKEKTGLFFGITAATAASIGAVASGLSAATALGTGIATAMNSDDGGGVSKNKLTAGQADVASGLDNSFANPPSRDTRPLGDLGTMQARLNYIGSNIQQLQKSSMQVPTKTSAPLGDLGTMQARLNYIGSNIQQLQKSSMQVPTKTSAQV